MSDNNDIRKKILLLSNAPFPELLLGRNFCERSDIEICCTKDQLKNAIDFNIFDFMFIDYLTPQTNLPLLVKLIREHDNTKTVPIYILDTQCDPLNRMFCKEVLGVDGYISGSVPMISTTPKANPNTNFELNW